MGSCFGSRGMRDPDLLDRLFPARVTIACIIAALVIAVGCGLYAWIA